MFTNEFEFDITRITVMDDSGQNEDVICELGDHGVDIKQFNESLNRWDLINMTPKMMLELIEAFKHTEGAFQTEVGHND